ncbi:MAG: transcriptional repressor NrdR [Clostridia bacterium]|nr:transcriptional repressor NrdR [Clostridia bacterium]
MKCPACGNPDLKVIDSRPIEEGNSIRRRRECLQCAKRFTTFEMIEQAQIIVIKKDGNKEPFDRNKLVTGILKSTRKRRSVDAEAIVDEIEAELQNTLHLEVTSVELGDRVLEKLRDIDEISYVRFASVYREFTDVDSFMDELKKLKKKHAKSKKTETPEN